MVKGLLAAFSRLYHALWYSERQFFHWLDFLVYRPRAKVLSVGNLTVGGTGKTPILLELLESLDNRRSVAILTRGYKSRWEGSFLLLQGRGPHPVGLTDESILVNQKFPEVPMLIGKNRAHAARLAEKWFHPDLLLLDDGFQYRRLKKDIDLVLWDATVDPRRAKLLPEGRLREPFERLSEASFLLLTRCEQVSPEARHRLKTFFREISPILPIIEMQTVPIGFRRWSGDTNPHEEKCALEAGPKRAILFAAIGNPEAFELQTQRIGVEIVDRVWFPDHYRFTTDDMKNLASRARQAGVALICTEKDFVKIPLHDTGVSVSYPHDGVYALIIGMKPVNGGTLADVLKIR